MFQATTQTQNPTTSPERWRRLHPKIRAAQDANGIDDALPRLAEYIAKAYYNEFRSSTASDAQGMLLMGGIGCGKTVRMRLMSTTLGIAMESADDLVTRIARHGASDDYYAQVARLEHVNCVNNPHYNDLIIDDLGTEPVEFVIYGTRRDLMHELLLNRYDAWSWYGWTTHITTNLDEVGIARRYGERMLSRLTEMCAILRMDGGDRRRQRRAQR